MSDIYLYFVEISGKIVIISGYFFIIFLWSFMDLKKLKIEAEKEIKKARSLKTLDDIFKKYLGKKGQITQAFATLKKLSERERKKIGKEANLVKIEIEKIIKEKSKELREELIGLKIKKEGIDISRPGKKLEVGHLHPLTQVRKEVEEIFQSMGFSVVEGPEVETEWYNFDALNIPKDHPARDFWDTFWLSQEAKLLLRTHTSPVQIRYMEKHNPPLRIIVPGRVFRHEATDASHEINFYQIEGLMVDKNISVANFKAIVEEFLRRFFKAKVEIRLRPSFFPFTEPSFEIDLKRGKGEWLEIMGAGMVHPNVFRFSGINPEDWQGFAFGVGMDRLAMLRYKINDVRLFYNGDLRFLKQF